MPRLPPHRLNRSRIVAWPDGRCRQKRKRQSHRACGRRTGRRRPGSRVGSATDRPDRKDPSLAGGGVQAISGRAWRVPTRKNCCCLGRDGCGRVQPSVASNLNTNEQARSHFSFVCCSATDVSLWCEIEYPLFYNCFSVAKYLVINSVALVLSSGHLRLATISGMLARTLYEIEMAKY